MPTVQSMIVVFAVACLLVESAPVPALVTKTAPSRGVRPLSEVFKKLDRDNDNGLSKNEVAALLDGANAAQSLASRTASIQLGIKTFDQQFKSMDSNRDGFLTTSELGDKQFHHPANKKIDRLCWRNADANRDGKISPEEYVYYMEPDLQGPFFFAAAKAVMSLDKNDDDILDSEEFSGGQKSKIKCNGVDKKQLIEQVGLLLPVKYREDAESKAEEASKADKAGALTKLSSWFFGDSESKKVAKKAGVSVRDIQKMLQVFDRQRHHGANSQLATIFEHSDEDGNGRLDQFEMGKASPMLGDHVHSFLLHTEM